MKLQTVFALIDLGLTLLIEIQESVQLDPADEQAVKDKIREVQGRIKTLRGTLVNETKI